MNATGAQAARVLSREVQDRQLKCPSKTGIAFLILGRELRTCSPLIARLRIPQTRPILPAYDAKSRMERPAFVRQSQELVARVRNHPIAPTIRFEIPIVEIAA